MNQHLQTILSFIQQSEHLSDEAKAALLKAAKNADKEFSITEFKLDRTEKVKRTTAILLEETIEELEQKRKAVEAQNKELEIEAALEKVRSRSLAMQKSDELTDVAAVLFKQVNELGIKPWTTGFNIWSDDSNSYEDYITNPQGGFIEPYVIDSTKFSVFTEVSDAKKSGENFYIQYVEGERLQKTYEYLSQFASKGQFQSILESGFEFPAHQYDHFVFGQKASLMFITYEPVPEAHVIFKRFGKVFEQTYTRFNDLKQAEAQARESQIQLALERVRARTMAMQHSNELSETALQMFEQLRLFDIALWSCGFNIFEKEEKECLSFIARDDKMLAPVKLHLTENEFLQLFYKSKEKEETFWFKDLEGKESKLIFDYVASQRQLQSGNSNLHAEVKLPPRRIFYFVNFSHGNIMFITTKPYPELHDIFERLGKVFNQTYTRFLELQKAEAQSRESQIELSLERVRAKTMAMHNSADVGETAAVMVEELKKLGIETIRCGIGIMHEPGDMEVWTISTDENNKTDIIIGWLDMNMHPLLHGAFESWRNNIENYSYELKDEDLLSYYNAINNYPGYPIRYDTTSLPKQIHHNEFHFAQGTLFAFSLQQLTVEQRKIFKRFAGVFGQTYRRYLDLKKAENSAREAQIEASLERVRSKAMMMQKSDDLSGAVAIVFEELNKLNIGLLRCGIGILHKEKRTADVYTTTITGNNSTMQVLGDEPMDIHPLLHNAFEAWLQQQDCEYTLKGEDLNNYYKALTQVNFKLPQSQSLVNTDENTCQYYFNAMSAFGGLFAFSDEVIAAGSRKIMKRFSNVFEQTYTRFLDIKKAEAQAKEAMIETALERVRSRTLAMQKSGELKETSSVLFKQLIGLGIEPHRLYISIIKDDEGQTEFWITDEEGSKISMAYEDNLNNNPSFKKMFNGWKQQEKSLAIDMQGKELKDYFKHLNSLGIPFKDGLTQKRRIQYLAFFNRGFIGMAAPDEQPEETLHLLERFAAVFNLTFTRFNDLKIAEVHALQAEQDLIEIKAARKKAEETLAELQSTQKQLVQSEKMASLGELTAGIAHEIQNPLNFVNNFSEVNKELIEELRIKNEKLKIEDDEINDLLNDLADNEEKINHHGRRADSIVKGMLQHSRQTSGIKEPTDINALCDEYLRLSYHGLRAKDKNFNADFKMNFDETIGMINIVPQDIGRVLLNLFNNAFYATNTKQKTANEIYKPLVSIQTKKINNKIEVTVSDNGNGIPQSIIDKIFHPFFTTKPTGEGTGLGLSLAYDIITKEHNGIIKVESKEGEGTRFIIQLPITA